MNTKEYTYNLVKTFQTNYASLVADMQISHNESPLGIYSNWHLEGSIYTHTMMVLAQMQDLVCKMPTRSKELLIAALLHDIGKVKTRKVLEDKVTFYDHANVSTFLAIDIISSLDPTLTNEQKVFILRLINYHQVFFQLTDDMTDKGYSRFKAKFNTPIGFELVQALKLHRIADFAGRIAKFEDGTQTQRLDQLYEELAYAQPKPKRIKELPHAIIMVGVPCSGKSTYIKNNYANYISISRDEQIMKYATKNMTYTDAWNIADQTQVDIDYETLLHSTIAAKKDLVIDKTNLTYKGRKKLLNLFRNAGYQTTIVVLLTQPFLIQQHTEKRIEKRVPSSAFNNMVASFQLPFEDEGETKYVFS